MAYLWEDKIADYYWSNPELDTVAILWTDEANISREHYIKVDETDQQWNDFVKIVPYEKINERTEVRHESFREEFREAFRKHAERNAVDDSALPDDLIFGLIFAYDNTDAEQKESLFKLKLKIFDQEIVKNSKSADKFKNAKTFIRKAENPIDVLLGYMVFANGAKLKMAPTEKFEVLGVYVPVK